MAQDLQFDDLHDLHDNLSRDRIVVGIKDKRHSEKLQVDPTLASAL